MTRSDYIPAVEAAFLAWAQNLIAYVLLHFSAWNIPSPQNTLSPLLTAFEDAFEVCKNPNRGKLDTQKKRETHKSLEKALRVYNKAYLLYNPAVSNDDRIAMRLPVYSGIRHKMQVPVTSPQLLPDTSTRRMIKIYYKDENSSRRGKPTGVKGIEVRWAKLKEAPKDISELVNSSFDTKPPLELTFEEHERGEKVYMCGRWEIQREGEKGPWGDIEEAIIP